MNERDLAFHGLAIKRHSTPAEVAGLTGQPVARVAALLTEAVATGRAIEAKGAMALTPLARLTVPFTGALTAVTVSVLPAGSGSLVSSDAAEIVAAVSSGVVAVSSTATGGSFAPVTVTVTWPMSVAVPSLTV